MNQKELPKNNKPGKDKRKDRHVLRRRFKVERLPLEAQKVIFDGFAQGTPYDEIRENAKKQGYAISRTAIGNYWRMVWKEEHDRLRRAKANLALLQHALRSDPESPLAKVAEDLLYTITLDKLEEIQSADAFVLLREAREQRKAAGTGSPRKKKQMSGTELAQQLDQIYGPGVVVEEIRDVR